MQLAQRLALVTAALSFGAATAACTKQDDKQPAPAAKVGAGAAAGDAMAARPVEPAAAPAPALSGLRGTMARAGGDGSMGDPLAPAGGTGDDADDDDGAAPAAAATPAPAWTGGDDCTAVGTRLMALAMHGMGELPAELRAELEADLGSSSKEVAAMCSEGAWPAEIRQCVVKSTTMSDAERCLASLAAP